MRKDKTDRRELISKIIGNSARSVGNHEKDQRPYIKLFQYFTDEELEEFINTGTMSKLDIVKDIETEKLVLIKDFSFVQLYEKINTGTERSNKKIDKQIILKNALFKVEQSLDKSFILPLFKEALLQVDISENVDICTAMFQRVESMKLGILRHENHRQIVLDFIKKYMTSEELLLLKDYFSKNQ